MSAWGGLILIALGLVCGVPIGYCWCHHDERRSRIRVRDNIRRIRRDHETLVLELAVCERENAELRDLLQWDRSLGEAS